MSDNKSLTPSLVMQRVYIKDASFEAPNMLQAMGGEWAPETQLDMNTSVTRLDEKAFEVVLCLTLTVKNNAQTAYICEIHQAGIFIIEGAEEEQVKKLLSCDAPALLFPYAREAVGSLVSKGSFPTLLLAPVDFEELYESALAEQQNIKQ